MSTSPSTSEMVVEYCGVVAKSARKAITVENAGQLLALIAVDSAAFRSAGTAGLVLLPLTLVAGKMACALVGKVGDLATKLPSVFGDTRSAAVITNVVSAGLVSAAATSMTNKDPLVSMGAGGAVLVGAGAAFVVKKLCEKGGCCATKPATTGARAPAASSPE